MVEPARALSAPAGLDRVQLTSGRRPLPSLLGPLAVTVMLLALFAGSRLATYGGNATGLIQFGRNNVSLTQPPRGAIIQSPYGYDGQYFWAQAQDPLLLRDSTVTRLRSQAYRTQRVAYPALAYVLGAGQESAIPWTMLAINVLAVLAATAMFADYARRRNWSVWWALAIGASPGFMLATMRDLSDPLATATALGGLLAWQRNRRWLATGLLTVAVLAREPMVLAAVAVAIDVLVGWARSPRELGRLRAGWAVALPAAAFVGWHLYIHNRFAVPPQPVSPASGAGSGSAPATLSQLVLPPFSDFVTEVRQSTHGGLTLASLWDLAYLGLMLAGIVAALDLLRRRVTAITVSATLLGLVLAVVYFGDEWGDSRYGLPLFVLLLAGGLEHRSRFAVAIATAVAAMTVLIPFAIPGA